MAQFPMNGGCFCKTIEYELNAEPIFVNCCHCRDCQCLSGSAFAVNIMIEKSNIKVTSSTQPIEKQESRPGRDPTSAKSFHCPSCAAMIWASHVHFGDEVAFLRAGTLAENDKILPDAHFFIRSKHPWIIVPEGLPTYETLPRPNDGKFFSDEAKARFDAVAARKPKTRGCEA